MPTSNIVSIDHPAGRAWLALERKALHRFLVAYLTSRGLKADPRLRTLMIAGIDRYPARFPVRSNELEVHLDLVLRLELELPPASQSLTAARQR